VTTLNFDAYWRDHGVSRGLKGLGDDAQKSGKHVESLSSHGSKLAAGFAAFAAVSVFHSFIEGARESNRVAAITSNVIRSTGGAANVTADQVGNLATAISNKTGADDETIQSGANMLLTFTNIRNEVGRGNDIFDQSTQAVTDMAAAMNNGEVSTQGVKAASIQLGKALNDPIKGVTALQKVGVTFDAQQRAQIKTLVQSGHTLEAQKIILHEVQREFGGTAAAAADPLQRISVILGNIGEDIGNKLLPALNTGADLLAAIPEPVYMAGAAFVTLGVGIIGAAKVINAVKTVSEGTAGIMRLLGLRTGEAAAAQVVEAGTAESAAVSTAAAGDAAAVAGTKFAGMAGKLGLAGAVVGLAAVSVEATSWLGKSEVTKTNTNDLADAFLHLGTSAKAPKPAIDAVSSATDEWYGKVQTGNDVMRQFGDLATGAFSMGWADIIGRAQSGTERVDRFNAVAGQMDAALAQLVRNGHGIEAAQQFDALMRATGLTGDELQHVKNRFGQYTAAEAEASAQATATTAAIGDQNSVLRGVQHGGNIATTALRAVAGAQATATATARRHGATLKALLDEYPNYQKEVLAAAGATSTAKADTVQLTAAQVRHVRATLSAKVATDLLTKSLEANNNATLSLMGGEDAWYAAVAAVSGAVKSNGRTLDVHSEKGRANRAVLEQLASAGLGYLSVIQRNNGVGPVFRRTLDQQWNKLYEAARRFGATRAEAHRYADQILKVPKALTTRVTTPGMDTARAKVQGLHRDINNLSNRRIKITVNSDGTFTQGSRKGAATGGAITGFSPTPTADNIPIAATAGEHMWTVGEVQGAGGHSNVERLRAMARAGMLPRFAAGGSISLRGAASVPSARALNAVIDADMMAAYKGAYSTGGMAGPMPGGSGVARWAPTILRALAMLGQSPGWLGTVESRMNRESGGNPTIVNRWDSNWIAGTPSVGLMQVIGPTYRAYAGPFRRTGPFLYGVSTNGLANTYAGLNYAVHRYGSLGALSRPGGYDRGGVARHPGLVPKYTNQPERWLSPRQTVAFERLIPTLERGGAGGEIHIHLNAPNYLGSRNELVDEFYRLARQGRLRQIITTATR
jgi:hypothetical protein